MDWRGREYCSLSLNFARFQSKVVPLLSVAGLICPKMIRIERYALWYRIVNFANVAVKSPSNTIEGDHPIE
jgi:hypothetical protein